MAAFGGVAFLSEQTSVRLIAASTLILGGVALAVVKRKPRVGRSSAQPRPKIRPVKSKKKTLKNRMTKGGIAALYHLG
jgi:hypothetical protein